MREKNIFFIENKLKEYTVLENTIIDMIHFLD
jgi:hypothetical protein